MSGVKFPIYLVAFLDQWVTTESGENMKYFPAFCCEQDARAFAEQTAKEDGEIPSLYRIVRYDFSGEVKEV